MTATEKLHPNTLVRYRRYQEQFNRLYHSERVRLDDVVVRVCRDYGISEATLWRAIRTTDSAPAPLATQLSMF